MSLVSLTWDVAHADVSKAVDDDPTNQLWDCATRHVPMGVAGEDVLRCLTFEFDAPDDVRSAVLYLDISAPTNSLQDTDSLVVAVDQPFDDCAWAQGAMPGCVIVHGGFHGGERSLVVDLLNLACDPAAPPTDQARQDAVRRAVESGRLQVMLQDDTSVVGGWLDINGDTAPTCGTSTDPVPAELLRAATTAAADDDGPGTTPIVAAIAGVAAIAVVGAAGAHRTRARRMARRIEVRHIAATPTVELDDHSDPSGPPTVAIGLSGWRDDVGTQTLLEGGR
jgi:hypothetical protein